MLGEEIYNSFLSDTSDIYNEIEKYLLNNEKISIDSELDSIFEYISENDFFESVLRNREFQSILPEVLSLEIQRKIKEIDEEQVIFKNIKDAFKDRNPSFEEIKIRPQNPSELEKYDTIFMDVMMGDNHDSVISVAEYLSKISTNKNPPQKIFLISSRDELNQNKSVIRSIAQISSLNFSILNKQFLQQEGASDYLALLLDNMNKYIEKANSLRDFLISYESAAQKAIENSKQALWNMDFSYLQQLYSQTDIENTPFSQALLGLFVKHHGSLLNSDETIHNKINVIENIFIEHKNNKFPSLSPEQTESIHNIESSSFLNNLTSPIKITLNEKDTPLNDKNLSKALPFGAILSNKDELREDCKILLHCTQQCDLSRNILKSDLSLIFIEANLICNELERNELSFPIYINNSQKRWWVNPKPKKIIAKTVNEISTEFQKEEFYLLNTMRESITRQIRAELFYQLSRIEKDIDPGHYIDRATVHIQFYDDDTRKNKVDYWFSDKQETELDESQENAIKISISKYFKRKEENTQSVKFSYHFLDGFHSNLLLWVRNKIISNNSNATIDLSAIESCLRNKLASTPNQTDQIVKVGDLSIYLATKDKYMDKKGMATIRASNKRKILLTILLD